MVSRRNTRGSSRKSKSRVASRKSKSRVASRKSKSRVASRKSKSRVASRKSKSRNYRRRQRGGANESLAQGADFSKFHMQQHGGSRALMGAPLDYTGELDASLRGAARITALDASYQEAASHGVQSGGARRKSKARKSKRKSKSKSKSRKSKSRKQRGGCGGAPVGQPTMLLDNYAKAGLPSFKAI